MRTVTSGLVTLEIRHLKRHPLILILKYENNVLSSMHSKLFKFNQLTGLWTPIIGRCWTRIIS